MAFKQPAHSASCLAPHLTMSCSTSQLNYLQLLALYQTVLTNKDNVLHCLNTQHQCPVYSAQ